MKKFQNGVMSIFSAIAYIAQLNLEWFFFTFLGAIIFGIGPSSATLIQFSNDYRENQIMYSFKDYWDHYKSQFKKTSLMGFIFIVLVAILTLSVRITNVYFKSIIWVGPLYTLFALIITYILFISFFTFVKASNKSFKECLKISIFISFRYPLQDLCILLAYYSFFLLFSKKSSLFIIFGMSIFFFTTEFFHSQMIKKLKKIDASNNSL